MQIGKDTEMMAEANNQTNFDEKLLNFKEVYLGVLYAFSMNGIKNCNLENETAKNKINSYAKEHLSEERIADWDYNEDYAKSFKYAEEFHLNNLQKDRIRIKLDALADNNSNDKLAVNIYVPREDQPDRELSIPIEVFLSIYPSEEIGFLFFNIKFIPNNHEDNTISTDNLIFAIQSLFEDRFKGTV